MSVVMMIGKGTWDEVTARGLRKDEKLIAHTSYGGFHEDDIVHCFMCPNRDKHSHKRLIDETCIRHQSGPNAGECACHPQGKILVHEKYIGATIYLRERNMYDDSDFYAGVYDYETNEVKEVEYGTTRAWTYANHAHPDLTDENVINVRRVYAKRQAIDITRRAMTMALVPKIGDKVKIVSGKYKNVTGTYGWRGRNKFKHSVEMIVRVDRPGEKAIFVKNEIIRHANFVTSVPLDIKMDAKAFAATTGLPKKPITDEEYANLQKIIDDAIQSCFTEERWEHALQYAIAYMGF